MSGRTNVGHALKTVVLNKLARRGADIGYVKRAVGLEVDFLVRQPGAGEELVQVCADVSAPTTLGRELRGLSAAAKDHRRAKQRLLVLDRDSLTRDAAPNVTAQPVYEWLLAPPIDN